MERNDPPDEMITRWLQDAAPQQLPQWVLDATFERTRASRQHIGWRDRPWRTWIPRPAPAFAGAAVLVIAVVVTVGLVVDQQASSGRQSAADAFLGTWISTSDADGGTQTMTVRAATGGAVEIVVTDDVASVCDRHPSTMTGTGRIESGTRLVIPAPIYACDDGSAPTALSGPPLEEQLRNLTYVYDRASDTLTVGAGSASVWRREGVAEATPEPAVVAIDDQPWDPSRFLGSWASTAADAGFLGTWEATDVDGSALRIGVRAGEIPDTYEILLLDDRAGGGRQRWPASDWPSPLCSTDSHTAGPIVMTGIGRIDGLALAIDAQTWICGQPNGSGPRAVSGDRAFDLKQAYAPLVHDPASDTLVGPAGVVWHHRPPGSDPIALPFWGTWPQSNLQDAEAAQRQADAGDPAATWQLAPELATPPQSESFPFPSRVPDAVAADRAEIVDRFFRNLGWDRYKTVSRRYPSAGGDLGWEFVRIRCGPGPNPLYPNDSVGGDCPPTIDGTHYETVRLNVWQPLRNGPSGIWVVSGSTTLAPADGRVLDFHNMGDVRRQYEQVVPPTKAQVVDALEAFLSARVAGHGAEAYLSEGYFDAAQPPTVPLLYATSGGDRYERFEITDVQEVADWPAGDFGVEVKLFARGGKDVVDQQLQIWPSPDGRFSMDSSITTENGIGVPDQLGSEE